MSRRASRPAPRIDVASAATVAPAATIPDEVARDRRLGRWVSGVVMVALAVWVGRGLADNPQVKWNVVGRYLLDGQILVGLRLTLVLAVVSMACAIVIGVLAGFSHLSRNPVLSVPGRLYVWVFRSVPTLIQLLFWGNLALFLPHLTLRIPGTDLTLFSVDTNSVLSPFIASIVALAVANGAYLAEIVRSGILAVEEGQRMAASALGLNWWKTQRKVVLPQALRVMIPPAGNQFITLLKETSLISVIAGGDILTKAQNISGANLRTIELLIVAAIWYLAVTSAASVVQSFLESRAGRGRSDVASRRWMDRTRKNRPSRPGRGRQEGAA